MVSSRSSALVRVTSAAPGADNSAGVSRSRVLPEPCGPYTPQVRSNGTHSSPDRGTAPVPSRQPTCAGEKRCEACWSRPWAPSLSVWRTAWCTGPLGEASDGGASDGGASGGRWKRTRLARAAASPASTESVIESVIEPADVDEGDEGASWLDLVDGRRPGPRRRVRARGAPYRSGRMSLRTRRSRPAPRAVSASARVAIPRRRPGPAVVQNHRAAHTVRTSRTSSRITATMTTSTGDGRPSGASTPAPTCPVTRPPKAGNRWGESGHSQPCPVSQAATPWAASSVAAATDSQVSRPAVGTSHPHGVGSGRRRPIPPAEPRVVVRVLRGLMPP